MDAKPQIAYEIISFSIFFRRRNEHLNIRFPVETNAYSRWKIRNPACLSATWFPRNKKRRSSSFQDVYEGYARLVRSIVPPRRPFAACSFLLLSHSPSVIFISPFSPAAKYRQFHRYRHRHHHHHHHHPLNLSRWRWAGSPSGAVLMLS